MFRRKPVRRNLRKGMKKVIGIYALERSQGVKAWENRPKKIRKRTLSHGILKSILVLEFIRTTQWEIGEKITKKSKNPRIINNYLLGFRKDTCIYNMNIIIINLRILLRSLAIRMLYKKKCLINYAQNKHLMERSWQKKGLEKLPRREFMVTWRKWLGGVLTNFKRIAKRLISRMKNNAYNVNVKNYTVSYARNLPRLPSFVISTSDCHWALNESRLLRLKTMQIVETNHIGSFADINIGMNAHYYALRSFTALVQECASSMRQTSKFFHRRRFLRYLKRRSRARNSFTFLNKVYIKLQSR